MSIFPEFSFPFNDLDDSEFSLVIYEMLNGPIRFHADRLSSLSFNPFLQNTRINLGHSFDLDPDINLSDSYNDCEYFIEDQLTCCLMKVGVFVTVVFLSCT